MYVYGTKDVERLLGVRVSAVRSLIRAGHITPRKGSRGRLQFSFQDLIILRTATTLSGANVPTRRVNRCLRQLRDALPDNLPLSGLSIVAIGDQVAVREGPRHWDTESGQYLLALDVTVEGGEVQVISRAAEDGAAHFEQGHDLEDGDAVAAIAAYEKCLATNAGHLDARVNCGRLLHLAGRLGEAERIYREAQSPNAMLLFNLAALLEDLDRESEAMEAYRTALEIDPGLADAHFNLARLHERAGNTRESFRHLLAYKRASD